MANKSQASPDGESVCARGGSQDLFLERHEIVVLRYFVAFGVDSLAPGKRHRTTNMAEKDARTMRQQNWCFSTEIMRHIISHMVNLGDYQSHLRVYQGKVLYGSTERRAL